MATTHSYGATLKNNKTESEAVDFVCSREACLKIPIKKERRQMLLSLGLPLSFARAFDLVMVPAGATTGLSEIPAESLKLVELKTTKKKLVSNPEGFFFGATANEFDLAERLGDNYMFCFVSLHAESRSYAFLTAQALEGKIKTKRLQYQINL